MKITLESRKTIWVPFIDTKAKLKIEWNALIEYNNSSIYHDNNHIAKMRYIFTDLKGAQFIPSSQLIIKEKNIPLTITGSVVQGSKDKFKSEQIDDPFIEINDKLAGIEKSKVLTRVLSARVIERMWTDSIKRTIKIENKTDKNIHLDLIINDKPTEEVTYVSSNPEPDKKESPEFTFNLQLKQDQSKTIKIELKHKNIEKIELPPDVKLQQGVTGGNQKQDVYLSEDAFQQILDNADENLNINEKEQK